MGVDASALIPTPIGAVPALDGVRGPYKRRISPKIGQAVALLAENPNMTQVNAAKLVGVTPQWLCKQLKRDNVKEYLARERKEKVLGAITVARAAHVYTTLLGAESEKIRAEVADRLLSADGVLPNAKGNQTRVGVNVAVTAGYVIKLRGKVEDDDAPTINATAEVVES